MNFADELNKYMELLDCSAKDICKVSNLSPTIISRYLNGKRTPRVNSEFFNKIVDGLLEIANQKNIILKRENLLNALIKSIEAGNISYNDFVNNFNSLMLELKINSTDFAKSLGYDASFISKIKTKSRKPADLDGFIKQISNYVVNNYKSEEKKQAVAFLLNCSVEDLNNIDIYKSNIINWLSISHEDNNKSIETFLTKLDKFNLNDYISTDFNKIKIPTAPIILRNSKTYYGKDRKETSRRRFLKNNLTFKIKRIYLFLQQFSYGRSWSR